MSAILSPFLGGAIDRIGGRAILSMVSAVSLIGVHSSISLMRNADLSDLYAPLVFQGLSYAVFAAALWPSVPYVVKRVRHPHKPGGGGDGVRVPCLACTAPDACFAGLGAGAPVHVCTNATPSPPCSTRPVPRTAS